RHGGTHFDSADLSGGDRHTGTQPETFSNTLHGSVAIRLPVFRKQLPCDQLAVRTARNHVGERAATVNPEIPGHGYTHVRLCSSAQTNSPPHRSIRGTIKSNPHFRLVLINLSYQCLLGVRACFATRTAISATFCAAKLSGVEGQLTTKLRLGSVMSVLSGRRRLSATTLGRIAGGMTAIPMPSSAIRTTVESEALA